MSFPRVKTVKMNARVWRFANVIKDYIGSNSLATSLVKHPCEQHLKLSPLYSVAFNHLRIPNPKLKRRSLPRECKQGRLDRKSASSRAATQAG